MNSTHSSRRTHNKHIGCHLLLSFSFFSSPDLVFTLAGCKKKTRHTHGNPYLPTQASLATPTAVPQTCRLHWWKQTHSRGANNSQEPNYIIL